MTVIGFAAVISTWLSSLRLHQLPPGKTDRPKRTQFSGSGSTELRVLKRWRFRLPLWNVMRNADWGLVLEVRIKGFGLGIRKGFPFGKLRVVREERLEREMAMEM